MAKIIVVGGGAAGILAAIAASKAGHLVTLLEKNEKLGKKLYITGKGRCNVTNAGDMEDIRTHVISNPKFMYSAFDSFTNKDLMKMIEEEGVPLKIERGNRVFPESDKSSDILKAFAKIIKEEKITVKLNTTVKELLLKPCIIDEAIQEGNEKKKKKKSAQFICYGVKTSTEEYHADWVIVATGGISYPSTGSTGDGYQFAKEGGHKITTLYPALVPFETKEEWVKDLQGLSLRNVEVSFIQGKKKIYSSFGELLFTHFGVSGPTVLSASSFCGKYLEKGPIELSINLKPALDANQLDARLLRDFEANKNKQIINVLGGLLPSKLIPVVINRLAMDTQKKVHDISKEERLHLVELMQSFTLTLTNLREFKEAIITQGGVSVKEVSPTTMESKLVKQLKFAGEVMDVDAYTGGYNLQIAWSTGWVAGSTIEK